MNLVEAAGKTGKQCSSLQSTDTHPMSKNTGWDAAAGRKKIYSWSVLKATDHISFQSFPLKKIIKLLDPPTCFLIGK